MQTDFILCCQRQGSGADVKASVFTHSVTSVYSRRSVGSCMQCDGFEAITTAFIYPGQSEGLTLINHQELISGKKKAMPLF